MTDKETVYLFEQLADLPIYLTVRDLPILYYSVLDEIQTYSMEVLEDKYSKYQHHLRTAKGHKIHMDLLFALFQSKVYHPEDDIIYFDISEEYSKYLRVISSSELNPCFVPFSEVYQTSGFYDAVEAAKDRFAGASSEFIENPDSCCEFLSGILKGEIDYNKIKEEWTEKRKS